MTGSGFGYFLYDGPLKINNRFSVKMAKVGEVEKCKYDLPSPNFRLFPRQLLEDFLTKKRRGDFPLENSHFWLSIWHINFCTFLAAPPFLYAKCQCPNPLVKSLLIYQSPHMISSFSPEKSAKFSPLDSVPKFEWLLDAGGLLILPPFLLFYLTPSSSLRLLPGNYWRRPPVCCVGLGLAPLFCFARFIVFHPTSCDVHNAIEGRSIPWPYPSFMAGSLLCESATHTVSLLSLPIRIKIFSRKKRTFWTEKQSFKFLPNFSWIFFSLFRLISPLYVYEFFIVLALAACAKTSIWGMGRQSQRESGWKEEEEEDAGRCIPILEFVGIFVPKVANVPEVIVGRFSALHPQRSPFSPNLPAMQF